VDALSPGYVTETASTSGTAINFTGIPANARKITVMFDAVSTNGTAAIRLTLGDSGGLETTGYNGTCSRLADGTANATTRFTAAALLVTGVAASVGYSGLITFARSNLSANTWAWSGNLHATGGATDTAYSLAGNKSLSAMLDRLTVTADGADTFDNGTITILVE
jgi:hypothetical protein